MSRKSYFEVGAGPDDGHDDPELKLRLRSQSQLLLTMDRDAAVELARALLDPENTKTDVTQVHLLGLLEVGISNGDPRDTEWDCWGD